MTNPSSPAEISSLMNDIRRYCDGEEMEYETLRTAMPQVLSYISLLEKEGHELREWIKKNCTEKSCWKDRDPECFSCQACTFLDSLPPR